MEKQRWEESERRREEETRERVRRKKMQASVREKEKVRRKKMQSREKVEKLRFNVFFPMICDSGGSKSRLAKAAGAEPSRQMRDENLHAVVARSTFPSQNAQRTSASEHFWKLQCWKSAHRCGAMHILSQNVPDTSRSEHFWKFRCRKSARGCGVKHISKSKCTKHLTFGALLEVAMPKKCTPFWRDAHSKSKCARHTRFRATMEVEMSKKCTLLWRKAHFQVKMLKAQNARTTFEGSDVVLRGRRKGFCTVTKVSKTWQFCSTFKSVGRCGTFEGDLEICILRGRHYTTDMFIRDVRRSGRWFPGKVPFWRTFRFAKMILLASLFRGKRRTLAKRIGTRPSALHSAFHFWRKSPRLASLLMFSTSKIEEVSQNFFVFDRQRRKLRKSCRIASFLTLSSWNIEEISQNSFAFKLANR